MQVNRERNKLKFVRPVCLCNYDITYEKLRALFYLVLCCQFYLHRISGVNEVMSPVQQNEIFLFTVAAVCSLMARCT